MIRIDGRKPSEMRKVNITRNYIKHAEGSVLIELGDTKVICTASMEDRVPPFLKGSGQGWITAEYSMIPRATAERNIRESSKGKLSGRTHEIQRLIGRALRSVVDLNSLGEKTVWIDCDVIQADGGTRTSSITGAYIAMVDALNKTFPAQNSNRKFPVRDYLAATSVGIIQNVHCLDLCYEEDSHAQVDMNIVMTGSGKLVEVQGTAEGQPFSIDDLNELIGVGKRGIESLFTAQKLALAEVGARIGE